MSTDRAESAEKFARSLNRADAIQGAARNHIEALVREVESLSSALVERDVKLAARAAPEPEWEYGRAHPGVWKRAPGVGVVVLADTPGNREPQEAEGYLIVRRRKAGPWEPLPAGGDDE